jgi:hypothetical protein
VVFVVVPPQLHGYFCEGDAHVGTVGLLRDNVVEAFLQLSFIGDGRFIIQGQFVLPQKILVLFQMFHTAARRCQ